MVAEPAADSETSSPSGTNGPAARARAQDRRAFTSQAHFVSLAREQALAGDSKAALSSLVTAYDLAPDNLALAARVMVLAHELDERVILDSVLDRILASNSVTPARWNGLVSQLVSKGKWQLAELLAGAALARINHKPSAATSARHLSTALGLNFAIYSMYSYSSQRNPAPALYPSTSRCVSLRSL